MNLLSAFNQYMDEEVLAAGGSLNTCNSYIYACKALIGAWGNIDVELVSLRMIKQFSLKFQRDHSLRTIKNYLSCLRAVLGMCERQGIDVIPPCNIVLPKTKAIPPTFIEENEADILIETAMQPSRGYPAINRLRNALIIKMLFTTGLRVGELCALNIKDIHNREFTVVGKSKEPRVCYITEEVEEMIDEYLNMRDDHDPALFVSNQTGGRRISVKTVQAMFRRVRGLVDMDEVHPHTMRHSFCTALLEAGVDIRDTAELMGHQSWNTTKIYTHISNQRLKGVYHSAMGQ